MIHDKIKKELENLRKTQKWLSDSAGIPASHISEFLRGKRNFSHEKLEKLAAAFGKEWVLVSKEKTKRLSDLLDD